MQTLTIHGVKKVTFVPTKYFDTTNYAPFFYRYLEVHDTSGNIVQICLYSDSAEAIEINEPKGETKSF